MSQQSHYWVYTLKKSKWKSKSKMCTPMFITALFRIARTWRQPRCPSTDEWIKKLQYIYSLEYYSAIKRSIFDSVLMRWINLESIRQSEVSQKKKDKYRIPTREQWLRRRRRAQRSYPMLKVRNGGSKEIPSSKVRSSGYRFPGAAVKRYPTPKVRETQVRWQVLQEGTRGQTH